MGVLLSKSAQGRIVVSCSQVDLVDLAVIILPAVTEGVEIVGVDILFYAEGVIDIGLYHVSGGVGQVGNIPVTVGGVIFR